MTKATRFGRGQFAEWGGGPYAAIAIVCFCWQEWAQLREFVQWIIETEFYTDKFGIRRLIREGAQNIGSFVVGSFMNGMGSQFKSVAQLPSPAVPSQWSV